MYRDSSDDGIQRRTGGGALAASGRDAKRALAYNIPDLMGQRMLLAVADIGLEWRP
jgi:hypothetical protein